MHHALQQYLRRSASVDRRVREVGPFSLIVHPGDDHPFLNYAIPQPDADPTAAEVAALVDAFAGERLVPRLELLPAAAPAVEPALLAAGFAVEARLRLMACVPQEARHVPTPSGVLLVDVDPEDDPDAALHLVRVQMTAFGQPVDDEDALREAARATSTPAVLAEADGVPAGGGLCRPAIDGTTEVAGIGVLEPFRRRGIAAAITARLLERSFASGVQRAILTPGDEDTARVYARCGFTGCGEMLHLRRG